LSRHTPKYELGGVEGALIDRFRRRLLAVAAGSRPATVLDAGCGEGFVAEWLSGAFGGARIVGVDVRDDALREASGRVPRAGFLVGDVMRLPFPDRSFDLVVCTEVLEHVEDPAGALRELRRVARGSVLVTVPHEPFFRAGNLLRGRHIRRLGSTPGHRWTWTRAEFRRLTPGDWFSLFPWQAILTHCPA
jgi:ubiquinone/menaquinone biosynthesis C-methylase UbiE